MTLYGPRKLSAAVTPRSPLLTAFLYFDHGRAHVISVVRIQRAPIDDGELLRARFGGELLAVQPHDYFVDDAHGQGFAQLERQADAVLDRGMPITGFWKKMCKTGNDKMRK